MTDAFEVLRRPDAPIAPSDSFAKRLRQQITAELQPLLAPSPNTTSSPRLRANERVVSMTVAPYLIVRNAAAALDFYRDAFGAVETSRLVGDDGRIGHAEFSIGTSPMMIADEYPEADALGPESYGGASCTFHLEVTDVDVAYAVAVSLGARSQRQPQDQFHGNRNALITDPFGHRWMLSTSIENLSAEEYGERAAAVDDGFGGGFSVQDHPADNAADAAPDHGHQVKHHEQGDLYYFTMPVQDLAKAQAFFGAVLGWQFASPDQGHVENISAPPGGINDRDDDSGARLWFVVDDIHAAVERVRASGGTAQEPVLYDSGWSANCTDDQGTVFSLSVPVAAYTA